MKKLLTILFLSIFLIGIVSAFNVKYYNKEIQTIKIDSRVWYDPFGWVIENEVAELKLDTPIYNVVFGEGYQRVAEITIDNKKSYKNAFNKIEFRENDIKGEIINNAGFDYKYLIYEDVEQNKLVCEIGNKSCSNIKEIVKQEKWIDFDNTKELPKGELTIGIYYNDVKSGEVIEWIPTWFGTEIKEWASFEGSTKYERYEQLETHTSNIGGVNYVAMTFTVGISGTNETFTLSGAAIRIFQDGTPENATLSIKALNSTGFPTGNNLAEGNFNASSISGDTNGVWYNVSMTPYNLEKGIKYALVLNSSSAGLHWKMNSTGNYIGGNNMYTESTINNWINSPAYDNLFQIWGNVFTGSPLSVSTALISPIENYNITTTYFNFSANATSTNGNLTNMTLWIWNSSSVYSNSEVKTLSNINLTQQNWTNINILTDGNYHWNVLSCALNKTLNVLCEFAPINRTFNLDVAPPLVNINYPISQIYTDGYVKQNNRTIQINWTVSDISLSTCWLDNGTANSTVTCSSNISYQNITYNKNNKYILYVNDTYGNRNQSETNFRFEYVIFENNVNYESPINDLIYTNIIANLSYNSTIYTNIFGYLIYNGTTSSITKTTEGNNYLFGQNFIIPATYIKENKTFFYNFIATNSSGTTFNFNTSQYSQEINPTYIILCNSTINATSLNFTFYDEIQQKIISGSDNATTLQVSFTYWIDSINTKKNYSYQNISSVANSYQFCISPANKTFEANVDIVYSATNYLENNYYLRNATLTNTQNNILLYLISSDMGTKFYLTFQKGTSFITNSIVNIQKYFIGEGTYKSVAIKETDDNGETSMFMDLDAKYQYTITKDGELIGIVERVSSCASAPCSLTIYVKEEIGDTFQQYGEYYAGNVLSNITFNKTSKIISYTFVDTTGLANNFNLKVQEVKLNQTGTIVCDSYSYSTAGTLYCNLTGRTGDFIATGYISRSPPKVDKVLGVLIDEDIIEDLGLTGIFLIMCLIIMLVFAAAIMSRGDPSTVIIFFGIGILFLKLMSIFPFSWIVVVSLEILIGLIYTKIKP